MSIYSFNSKRTNRLANTRDLDKTRLLYKPFIMKQLPCNVCHEKQTNPVCRIRWTVDLINVTVSVAGAMTYKQYNCSSLLVTIIMPDVFLRTERATFLYYADCKQRWKKTYFLHFTRKLPFQPLENIVMDITRFIHNLIQEVPLQ